MSFKQGEKIHAHNGRTYRVGKGGKIPNMGRREISRIRGFIRGELIDCVTGEKQTGDWHENVITTYGHNMVVRNYAGIGSSVAAGANATLAAATSDMGWAKFWGIGYMTEAQSSNFSTMSKIDSTEWGIQSTGGVSRATVTNGSQCLSGTWSLSQSFQYASTQISHAQTVNCIAQYHNSSVGAGTAHSLATFASSTKGTTQALNVTYNFVFST